MPPTIGKSSIGTISLAKVAPEASADPEVE
jgi:hypothetical protein